MKTHDNTQPGAAGHDGKGSGRHDAEAGCSPSLTRTAADCGVDPVSLLVQQATVLGALAGPEAGWQGPAGLERDIAPNLLMPEPGSLQQRLLGQQLDTARGLQQRLRQTSGQFRAEFLEFARYGHDPGNSKSGGADYLSRFARERHAAAIGFESEGVEGCNSSSALSAFGGPACSFRTDLAQSVPAVREEALRRPSFLLENPTLALLRQHAATLHLGRGLVVGTLGNLIRKRRSRSGKPGAGDERGLADFLAGFDTRLPEATGMQPLNDEVRVKASAVLSATSAEVRRLADEDSGLLDHFALVRSAGPPASDNTGSGDGDNSLLTMMPDAVRSILGKRRDGVGIIHGMRDPEKARRFHRQHIAFMARLDETAEPVAGLAPVPTSLAWALAALHPHHDVGDLILRVAAPFAGILLERHLAILANLEKVAAVAEVEPEREIAIVERIRKHGPLTDRQLVRKFSVQRKDVHQPAIDRLLSEGVLVRDDQARLCLGPAVEEFEKAFAR